MKVELHGIFKSYGRRKVLSDLSLCVEPGEFHVISGPSGEGKTTLLGIVAGTVWPDRGTVYMNERDVTYKNASDRNVGYIFQENRLFPHLNVFENIAFGPKAARMKRNEIKRRVEYYIDLINMEGFEKHYPSMLSGGQKQRIAIARALALEPDVLVCDEPFSGLDGCLKDQMMEELKFIQGETGKTILYVTHQLHEARFLADTMSVLHNGSIVQHEETGTLLKNPKTSFVAQFTGAVNIINIRVKEILPGCILTSVTDSSGNELFDILVKSHPWFLKRKAGELCIHPENIKLEPEDSTGPNNLTGTVLSVREVDHGLLVSFETEGLVLSGFSEKTRCYNPGDTILFELPYDCFHPLCGNVRQKPEGSRLCEQVSCINAAVNADREGRAI